ncbi:MAG: hypothetical protein KTR25_16130 [Myxococcales bacterium]|nr:hypothetical protein [Myxococcales bacterium]
MKRPDHKKSLLGRVPPGTLASSSERFTKSLARQLHTGLNQQAARGCAPLRSRNLGSTQGIFAVCMAANGMIIASWSFFADYRCS